MVAELCLTPYPPKGGTRKTQECDKQYNNIARHKKSPHKIVN